MPPLDDTNIETEFKSLGDSMKKVSDETKRFAEQATTEIKNFGKMTDETKALADKALVELGATNARLGEIEQRLARRGSGAEPVEMKSLGDHVLGDERVKGFHSGTRGTVALRVEYKDITTASSTVGTGVSASTSLVPADRRGVTVMLPDRRLVVRDLITPGETTSGNIEYVRETGWTNAAAPVAEGALKPQSNITFDLVNSPVRTLAHTFKASRQVMDDAPQLRSIIDGRLRYGLQLVEENQILNGSGSGANLHGIIPQATAYAAPFTPDGDLTSIDILRLAALQAALAEYPSSGFVLNPIDWARVEMTKTTQGEYLFANPQGIAAPTLWGLPVVATQAMASGVFLTGAFRLGAQLFDRMAIEVLLSTEDQDNFVKNMVTVRGEERVALAVYRPAAFITGSVVPA